MTDRLLTAENAKATQSSRSKTKSALSALARRSLRLKAFFKIGEMILSADQRSDLFPSHHFPDVSALIQVEDDDRQVVVFAE